MEVLDPDCASSEPFAFIILKKLVNMLAPVATFSHVAGPQLMLFEAQSWSLSGNLEISDQDNLNEPVDNQPPQITNTGFTVLEGNSFLLTSNQLDATDEDTSADQIVFTVTQVLEHGHLHYLEEGLMVQGESFLLDDIAGEHISYKHSGDEFASDSYQLQGTGEDTDDLVLTFIVQDPPKLGDILTDGVRSEKITQHNLINGAAAYAHTSGEIALKNRHGQIMQQLSTSTVSVHSFPLEEIQEASSIRYEHDDSETKEATQIPVPSQILYNSNYPVTSFTKEDLNDNLTSYRHDADIDEMKISYILKEGYNATSSIFYFFIEDEGIGTKDGTAVKDKDFKVRFNPGQAFSHLIPAIATIEIVDPGEGSTVYIPQLEYKMEEDKVSGPLAAESSLNTQMFLLSQKELWISDGSAGFGEGADVAFTKGSEIYSRVMDKAQPETQARAFGNLEFHATLGTDCADAFPLVKQPGSDGVSLSSTPLFPGGSWPRMVHSHYLHGPIAGRCTQAQWQKKSRLPPCDVLCWGRAVTTTAFKCS
ncbi:hypothetical protein AV530_012025 [Patagioenas fasciata monilis]|uniref:Uncharacterized protein n=1 Tax=Patagioenas fasciata monilis TaxID=372326 RepID=A0A1V4JUT4_PATFA|nr:hypothetical protein AV530_012025 [Patagioenas fasciata monilis]